MKDAVKPLRGCGARVVHPALPRRQVAHTDAAVLRCLALETRVRGPLNALDFGCTPDPPLDFGGHRRAIFM